MTVTAFIRHARHNAAVGWSLSAHAADWPSRLALIGLATSLQIKQRTPWSMSTVPVHVNIGGAECRVRLGAHTDLEILHEIVISGEYDELPCDDARCIVDLGAHIGLATLRLLAANPRAHVVAVEADPKLIKQLRTNLAGLRVTVVNAAVAHRSGPQTLYRSDVFSWANSLSQTMPQQSPVSVEGVTLRDIFERYGLKHVDLLKVDIEGAEWDVFREGVPQQVSAIIGEIHRSEGRPPRELLDSLRNDFSLRIGREDATRLTFWGVRNERSGTPAAMPSRACPNVSRVTKV